MDQEPSSQTACQTNKTWSSQCKTHCIEINVLTTGLTFYTLNVHNSWAFEVGRCKPLFRVVIHILWRVQSATQHAGQMSSLASGSWIVDRAPCQRAQVPASQHQSGRLSFVNPRKMIKWYTGIIKYMATPCKWSLNRFKILSISCFLHHQQPSVHIIQSSYPF